VGISPVEALALLAAGVLGGVVSVVVSLASLVTYPALLLAGLPPVAANVTSTVAQTFTGLGTALGARRELAGQRTLLLRLALLSALGGALGAGLLLVLPGRSFEVVAPLLVGGASMMILAQPRLAHHRAFQPQGIHLWTGLAYVAVSAYIGYFGAGGGIIALVVLAAIINRPLGHVNLAKSALAGVANGAAAIGFMFFGPVRWAYVIPLAVGLFVGGFLGPWLVRRVPVRLLRGLIAAAGLGVALILAWRAYNST
jgi:uncharacterized membrane protein YfcA